jgi:hypothetical protein
MPRIVTEGPDDRLIDTDTAIVAASYLHWSTIFAGAILAAAVSFVLISFGSGIGLAVASPSSSWRDTSSVLALLAGLWLLLTSLASFGLGGYLAGHLRESWSAAPPDAVEFRDGIHGLLVWGLDPHGSASDALGLENDRRTRGLDGPNGSARRTSVRVRA